MGVDKLMISHNRATLFSFFISLFVWLMSGCSHSQPVQQTCEPWAEISKGEYVLTNNVWGAKGIKPIKQCIAINNQGFEWSWDWKSRQGKKFQGNVLAYPSILYGHKPWNKKSTTPNLPIKISHIKKLDVALKVNQVGSGSHNVLLESWVTSSAVPKPSTRTVEIAIHLSQQNWPGMPGRKVDSVDIDGHSFDVYVDPAIEVPGDDLRWMYLGFVYNGTSGVIESVDMAPFISYLLKKEYVQGEHYLASVELGSELVNGVGKTTVKEFTVQL